MAEEDNFPSQSYSFVCSGLLKALIAVIVVLTATLVSKKVNNQDDAAKSNSDETNFCSSSQCVRCSSRNHIMAIGVLSQKLNEFVRIRGGRAKLERIYKSVQQYKTTTKKADGVSAQKPTVIYIKGLSCKPWYDFDGLELLRTLSVELNYELIKSEFKRIRFNKGEGWIKNTTPDGEWLVYHLFNQGEKVTRNCNLCPYTVQVIESIEPFIRGCSFGNALFSVIRPRTHITEHYGPTNCRIRCHVPLFVPKGCCLRVNGEEKKWKENELLLFDDSFLHEAWNRGVDGDRVVLMLDLWHPELTCFEREAITFLFPSVVINDMG